ncbi:trigger factor [Balneicella halophila]|uniref:Trigger factor n=1 Tax=Balneicella halophila TaxID=1537566 RepID=A0A7L4UPE4_BALHA|nr:trigger factor [Balneicella halophila]PVX51013.1 trigger factor [Balneicella halophila]
MDIVRNDNDALNATITVKVTPEDYEANVEKTLKEQQKKAEIKGFRKGKVPMGIMKKLYGTSVLVDEVNKVVSNNLYKYIVDNNIDILGEPLPNETEQAEVDWKKDKEFSFSYDIGLSPEINIDATEDTKVKRYPIIVSDEMIDNGIEMHARRFGENKEVEEVADNDLLRGDFVELARVNPKKDGIQKDNVAIALEYMKDEEIKKQFIGAKAGETIDFDLKKAYPNLSDLASLLDVKKEEIEEANSKFRFTIKEISRFESHEVNQELFDKVYGEGTVKSEEEFRAKIKEEIESQVAGDVDYKLGLDIKELLQEQADFELPEAFLKRWLVLANKDFTKESVEENFENYAKEIKWQLIKAKIAKENELKVNPEDIKALAKTFALTQFRQYGIMDVPEEHLEQYANQMMQNQQEVQKLHERVEEQKVLDFIKSKVTLEDKEVTVEEFNKMFEE